MGCACSNDEDLDQTPTIAPSGTNDEDRQLSSTRTSERVSVGSSRRGSLGEDGWKSGGRPPRAPVVGGRGGGGSATTVIEVTLPDQKKFSVIANVGGSRQLKYAPQSKQTHQAIQELPNYSPLDNQHLGASAPVQTAAPAAKRSPPRGGGDPKWPRHKPLRLPMQYAAEDYHHDCVKRIRYQMSVADRNWSRSRWNIIPSADTADPTDYAQGRVSFCCMRSLPPSQPCCRLLSHTIPFGIPPSSSLHEPNLL